MKNLHKKRLTNLIIIAKLKFLVLKDYADY